MTDSPLDFELLCRVAEVAWPAIGRLDGVAQRRVLALTRFGAPVLSPRASEGERLTSRIRPAVELAAKEWCCLFDLWSEQTDQFVFDDGFAVLFFARLLWMGQPVILRGHFDAEWTLESSLMRAEKRLTRQEILEQGRKAEAFVAHLQRLEVVRKAYPSGLPPEHAIAIKQHYGFPTDFIDCTLNFDVALFFAEGGSDYARESRTPQLGRVYVFPSFAIARRTSLVTLSPKMMRPSLQRATFMMVLSADDVRELTQFSFQYRHQEQPIWNGLGGIRFGAPAGLGRYLFPATDPVEVLACHVREGQTPEIGDV